MTLFRSIVVTGVLLTFGLLAGCGEAEPKAGDAVQKPQPKAGETIHRPDQPPITMVDDEDPTMLAAIAKARATADEFVVALGKPMKGQMAFSVKLLVKDGEQGEHMWLTPVRYENGKFIGTLGNEPDQLKNVKLGDELSVAKGEISDWMYIDQEKLVGGYTLRVLRDSMSASERAEFDQSVPFKVE